jgi:hypothetical protein
MVMLHWLTQYSFSRCYSAFVIRHHFVVINIIVNIIINVTITHSLTQYSIEATNFLLIYYHFQQIFFAPNTG